MCPSVARVTLAPPVLLSSEPEWSRWGFWECTPSLRQEGGTSLAAQPFLMPGAARGLPPQKVLCEKKQDRPPPAASSLLCGVRGMRPAAGERQPVPGAVQRGAWLSQTVPEGLLKKKKKSSFFVSLVLTLKENHPDSFFWNCFHLAKHRK